MLKKSSLITSTKTLGSKNSNYLRCGFLSDVHLGNNLTKTDFIISNLNKHLPDNENTQELDILFITGDLFDKALMLTDPDSFAVKVWIYRLLNLCKKRDIVLRVLKGTPSHDWEQCGYFELINNKAKIGADVKYFSDIDIEFNERFGISILYVPDNCRVDTETIYKDVVGKLSEHNLTQVDAGIMHGTFDFQLPEIANIDKHVSDRYLDLVKYFIVAGHIHQPNRKKHLYIPASFDRLCHGDEGFKGWMLLDCYHGDEKFKKVKLTRIENKDAKRFDTVDVRKLELEDAIEKIENHAKSLPDQSYIRIYSNRGNAIFSRLNTFKTLFPFLIWDSKEERDTKLASKDLLTFKQPNVRKHITKDNIVDVTRDKLSTITDDETLINLCCLKLDEIL